jgi:hypothetical protein
VLRFYLHSARHELTTQAYMLSTAAWTAGVVRHLDIHAQSKRSSGSHPSAHALSALTASKERSAAVFCREQEFFTHARHRSDDVFFKAAYFSQLFLQPVATIDSTTSSDKQDNWKPEPMSDTGPQPTSFQSRASSPLLGLPIHIPPPAPLVIVLDAGHRFPARRHHEDQRAEHS